MRPQGKKQLTKITKTFGAEVGALKEVNVSYRLSTRPHRSTAKRSHVSNPIGTYNPLQGTQLYKARKKLGTFSKFRIPAFRYARTLIKRAYVGNVAPPKIALATRIAVGATLQKSTERTAGTPLTCAVAPSSLRKTNQATIEDESDRTKKLPACLSDERFTEAVRSSIATKHHGG